jgi:hypothetical protein
LTLSLSLSGQQHRLFNQTALYQTPTTPQPNPNRPPKGGIYDTKYISRQLSEVFGRDTSLSDVYTGLVEGGKSLEVAALLRRAGGAGAAGELPVVKHAEGFDKYRWVGFGGWADACLS